MATLSNQRRELKILMVIGSTDSDISPSILEEIKGITEIAENHQSIEIDGTNFDQLANKFQEFKPNILHYCGHGTRDGNLVMEEGIEKLYRIYTDELSHLLAPGRDFLWGVVLNACFAQQKVNFIRNHVAFVISMKTEIYNGSARKYAVALYQNLVESWNVYTAHRDAFNKIRLLDPNFSATYELGEGAYLPQMPALSRPQQISISGPVISAPTDTIGRDELVEEYVQALLARPPRALLISGAGGMGKTTVALQVLNHADVEVRFTSKRYFVSCETIKNIETLVQNLVGKLSPDFTSNGSNPLDVLEELLTSLRAPLLLCLDNFETITALDTQSTEAPSTAEYVRSLLNCSKIILMVTMRADNPPYPSTKWYEPGKTLQPLDFNSSCQLFISLAHLSPPLNKEDSNALDILLKDLDGHPLALTLAAHQVTKKYKLAEVLQRYHKTLSKLDLNGKIKNKQLSLQVSINSSFESAYLDNNDRVMFQCLSLLPYGLHRENASILINSGDADENMQRLLDNALISIDMSNSRIIMHPVIREFGIQLLSTPAHPIAIQKSLSVLSDKRFEMRSPSSSETTVFGILHRLGQHLLFEMDGDRGLDMELTERQISRRYLDLQNLLSLLNDSKVQVDIDKSLLSKNFKTIATIFSEAGMRQEALSAGTVRVSLARLQFQWNPTSDTLCSLAVSLASLSAFSSLAGQTAESVVTAEEAVLLARELAGDQSSLVKSALAKTLNNFANCLNDLGRYTESLDAIKEAVKIRRELYLEDPDTFKPDLANSLNNLSNALRTMHRYEEAYEAVRESVEMQTELNAKHCNAFHRSSLSSSLNSLSRLLSSLGRDKEALQAIEESVRMQTELYAEHPHAFQSNLALTLHNLSHALSALGRHIEALVEIKKAVKMRRELQAKHPQAFGSQLASSLDSLSLHLSALGDHELALEATEEAVQLLRDLYAEHPQAFKSHLAGALHTHSDCLERFRQYEKALEAMKEAVKMTRELHAEHPRVYQSRLAALLHGLSLRLFSLGRYQESIYAIEEEELLLKQLYTDFTSEIDLDLTQCTINLGKSLNVRSNILSTLGYRSEALKVVTVAVTILRKLPEETPHPFKLNLATSLNNLSLRLSSLGRHSEALEPVQEAVKILRDLFADEPYVFKTSLTSTLITLSLRLANLRRDVEAIKIIEEAIGKLRELRSESSRTFKPADLAYSLNLHSAYLSILGRHDRALEAIKEAVKIQRELYAELPRKHKPKLVFYLEVLANEFSALGWYSEALDSHTEGLPLYRQLYTDNPEGYAEGFAGVLQDSASCLVNLGREDEAEELKAEANSIWVPKYEP